MERPLAAVNHRIAAEIKPISGEFGALGTPDEKRSTILTRAFSKREASNPRT